MDMVAGAKKVIVAMEHATKDGKPKILKKCSLPLTGKGVVSVIVTELAVFDLAPGRQPAGLVLREISPEISVDALRKLTEPDFTLAAPLIPFPVPVGTS
jgi:3-oxoacid CoA-transferase B subunit